MINDYKKIFADIKILIKYNKIYLLFVTCNRLTVCILQCT